MILDKPSWTYSTSKMHIVSLYVRPSNTELGTSLFEYSIDLGRLIMKLFHITLLSGKSTYLSSDVISIRYHSQSFKTSA